MKKIALVALVLGLVIQVSALDKLSGLPSGQKKVLDSAIQKLNIPDTPEVREKIFKRLKPYFKAKDWNGRWTHNASAANSKIKEAESRVFDLMIYNTSRVVNVTMVSFPMQKQIYVSAKEYLHSSSEKVLKKFEQYKKDSKYEMEEETDNYAYFQEKGYMDYTAFHVKSPSAMIVYESAVFIDIP